MPLGERLLTILVPVRRFVEAILIGTDDEPIHDRLDSGNSTRHNYCLVCLIVRVHKAGQLDDAILDCTDVDRTLTERRIVSECFEHSFLELFGSIE